MKKQLASFPDFLATGVLGPVSPDMRLIEIAQARVTRRMEYQRR